MTFRAVRLRVDVLPSRCSLEVKPCVDPARYQVRPIQHRPEGDLEGPWSEHDDGERLVWADLWRVAP